MVFPIPPTNLPDTSTASTPKVKVEAVNKVAPVVLNDQVSVDPRTALKLPDPVVQMQSGAQVRSALSHPGLIAGELDAGHAALLEGMASHASILQGSLKPQSAELGKLLAQLASLDPGDALQGNWPGVNDKPWRGPGNEVLSPKQVMQHLLLSLSSSSIFSARHLVDVLGPKILHPSGIDDVSLQDETTKVLENLSSESAVAKESARLLLHGHLFWQGELMPGVQARITREDAWENDPEHDGQLLKGSQISLEINLPRAGLFKVTGVQFGESLRLKIETSPDKQGIFREHLAELDSRFKDQIETPVNYVVTNISESKS